MSPHFHRLCPPPHSSSPFHHIVPISSLAWMSPLLLHCLPPVQPLSWIFLIAHVLHHTRLHPSIASFPTSLLSQMSPHFHCLCPPPHSSSPFHHFVSHLFTFPDVPPFSSPMPSTALIFTLLSHRSHLFACLDVPPSPALPSTSPTPQFDHFLRLCPPPQSSSPFHRFISHLFAFLDVPPFSSPMSSAALVFTLLSLHLPHLFTCPDVLHCLPPLQPLGWIISCPFPPPHSSSPFCCFVSHLFTCLDVPTSPTLPCTTLSLHFPHLFTCPDVLHHLPPLQPLGWIISCPSPPLHSSSPFRCFVSHLFTCLDVPPSPALPSTTPNPRLDHFTTFSPPYMPPPFHYFCGPLPPPTSQVALPCCHIPTPILLQLLKARFTRLHPSCSLQDHLQ